VTTCSFVTAGVVHAKFPINWKDRHADPYGLGSVTTSTAGGRIESAATARRHDLGAL